MAAEAQNQEEQKEKKEEIKFDPSSFLSEEEKDKGEEGENEEPVESSREDNESEEQEKDEDDFSWDDLEISEEAAKEKMEAGDKVDTEKAEEKPEKEQGEAEEPKAEEGSDEPWMQISKDLGIEAKSYEEFVEKVKKQPEKVYVSGDEKISSVDKILSMSTEDRIKAVMSGDKRFSKEDIDEFIEINKRNGTLKFEDKKIISDLERYKENRINSLKTAEAKEEAARAERIKNFDAALTDSLSKTNAILGGAIGADERKAVKEYIASGKFQDELVNNTDALLETAFFRLYRPKVVKMLENRGVTKGKRSVLENLTPTKKKSNGMAIADESGEFDPDRFMK